MNKLMRKLSISILAVVFAVVAMGATTFAWFTLTNTAKVTQFDVEVTSAQGIELSVVNGVWGSTIDGSVIEGLPGVLGAKLTAVTTSNGTSGFVTLDSLSEDGTYDITTPAVSGSHYVEFTIKVRSREISKNIYIDPTTTDITSAGITWQPDTTFTLSDGLTEITSATVAFPVYASAAARMSFTGANTVIYEDSTLGTSGMSSNWTNGALEYYAAKMNYDAPEALDPALTPYGVKEVGTAEGTIIATTASSLTGGWSEATIVVRIWLEGWDAECYNAIFNDKLQITIGFTTINPAA